MKKIRKGNIGNEVIIVGAPHKHRGHTGMVANWHRRELGTSRGFRLLYTINCSCGDVLNNIQSGSFNLIQPVNIQPIGVLSSDA